jgi:hypothetical protein
MNSYIAKFLNANLTEIIQTFLILGFFDEFLKK